MSVVEHIKGLQHLGIPTADIEETKAWYKNVLGFEVLYETEIMEEKGMTKVAFLKLGSLVVETYQTADNKKDNVEDKKPDPIDHIALDVDDIDIVFEKITSMGMHAIEGKPRFLPFWDKGVKFFTVYGPNNEKVEFNQILKD